VVFLYVSKKSIAIAVLNITEKDMRTPHSRVQRGKKVFVELLDGTSFIAKFHDKHGQTLKFYDHEDVWAGDLVKFIIYKPKM
jgi:hypothetical protein